jgi:hypothetical protein
MQQRNLHNLGQILLTHVAHLYEAAAREASLNAYSSSPVAQLSR